MLDVEQTIVSPMRPIPVEQCSTACATMFGLGVDLSVSKFVTDQPKANGVPSARQPGQSPSSATFAPRNAQRSRGQCFCAGQRHGGCAHAMWMASETSRSVNACSRARVCFSRFLYFTSLLRACTCERNAMRWASAVCVFVKPRTTIDCFRPRRSVNVRGVRIVVVSRLYM